MELNDLLQRAETEAGESLAAPLATILVGVGVFVLWIAPDSLWPGYRGYWLFQNAITGHLSGLAGAAASSGVAAVAQPPRGTNAGRP